MQMCVRRTCEHDQRSCIAHYCWQSGGFRIERPEDHPMWTDRDGRARPVEWICIASLLRAVEHIDQPRGGICGLGLLRKTVHHPLQSHRISAHIGLPNEILVSGHAYPMICAWTQYGHLALSIHFGHGGLSGDTIRTGKQCSSNLSLCDLSGHGVISVHIFASSGSVIRIHFIVLNR